MVNQFFGNQPIYALVAGGIAMILSGLLTLRVHDEAVITIEEGEFLFDALIRMVRHGIERLVVLRDQQPIGLVEMGDILGFLSSHSHVIALRVAQAKSFDDLRQASAGIVDLARSLFAQRVGIRFIMDLLAAEITAKTGRDPGEHYRALEERFGAPVYERMDAPASPQQKAVLKNLSPEQVTASELAGEPILAKLTEAPGNGAAIGGLKVTTENGWFAARPSGTENIYKIYAESFLGADHLRRIQEQAQAIVSYALGDA